MSLPISSSSITPPNSFSTQNTTPPTESISPPAVEEIVKECLAAIVDQVIRQIESKAETVKNEPPKIAEACFMAPLRAVCVSVTEQIITPPVEKSRFFVITSEPSGNLPIGNWSVRKVGPGESGIEWDALPFPKDLLANVKELEKLLIREESQSLNEQETARKKELESTLGV